MNWTPGGEQVPTLSLTVSRPTSPMQVVQEELHPHPRAAVTGPAGQRLPLWGASVREPCTHRGPYLTQRTHRALWGFGHMCVRAAHFRITHSKGKEMAKCGFVLSAVWLGWSGRCSCFSGQGRPAAPLGRRALGRPSSAQ